MVDKRKNIKRKLRKLRQLKRLEAQRNERVEPTSRGDALISSMEALIRKMSMTPTAAPSTIVSNPPAPAPIQPQIKTEITKEDIANEIARQREVDMLRNQVHYMYDKMNDDLRAKRSTGEMMAEMQARGTSVKPKDFGIDENSEIYKVQKDAAKSKQKLFTLTKHEILDQQDIARKERAVLHDTLSQTLISKLQNMATTPTKHSTKPSLSSPFTYERESNTMTNPKLSTTTSSSFDIDYVSPPKYKKTPLKLSHLFDSTPRYNDTSVFDKEAGNAMEIEYSAPSTPKQKTNSSLQSSPPPIKSMSPPGSPSSVSSNDSILTYADDLEKMQLATDDFQIIQRAAEQFAEKSFEEVGDTVSKLAVKQKIDEFSQQQYDNKREIMLQQYNVLRDTNDKILNKMKQIIGSHTSLSPDRKLEKALYNKSIRNTLENRIHQLECDIIKKNAAIREAEWYQNRVVKDPVKQSQNRAKIQYSKDLVARMQQELRDTKTQLKDSTDNRINALQNERTLKMKNLQDEINAKLANDPDLRQLVRQRDNIQYMINTDNRRTNIGINTDPNGAKEALDNVKTLVEQHVNKLSEEGEC